MPRIQRTFHRWNRRYKRVAVHAPTRADAGAETRGGVACFFSCGADSFHAVLRRPDELSALVYAKPFEPRIAGTSGQDVLDRSVRAAAGELGVPLVEIETNIRLVWKDWLSWEYFHGAAVASLGLALSPRFGEMLFPPGLSSNLLMPWGVHPDLDPLWSTEEVEFRQVDYEVTRFDRIVSIAESEVALRYLQLCWERLNDEYNCCRCEKCLRTMLTLHAIGKLEDCPTFPLPLTPEAVAGLWFDSKHVRVQELENLRALEATGRDEELVRALRRAFKRRPIASARHALGRRRRAQPVG